MRATTLGCAMSLSAGLLGCAPDSGPADPAVTDSLALTLGAVRVTVATTGEDLDVDGYRLIVFDELGFRVAIGAKGTLEPDGVTLLTRLPATEHTLELTAHAGNCTIAGENPRKVRVAARETLASRFDVRCAWAGPERIIVSAGGQLLSMSVHASGLRLIEPMTYNYFAVLSPDGKQIAFTSDRDRNQEIYVINVDGTGRVNLTNSPGTRDWWPKWSPDGSRIIFNSWETGPGPDTGELYVMNADGSGRWERLTFNQKLDADPEWSPDGSKIVFMSERDGNQEIYVMNADGSGTVRLTNDPGLDGTPTWSPDGKRIAFASTRHSLATEAYDIFVMNADGSNQVRLTSHSEIDVNPVWSPDGKQLVYTHRVEPGDLDVWLINADGSGNVLLLGGPGSQRAESWGRIR